MHKFAKEIAECLKTKVNAIGIDNIEGANLEEVKAWSEIVKNLVCFDKDFKIIEAMEESEDNEKIMEKIGMYTDYPEDDKRFYDNYRYSNGRFAPKGRGMRMRYTEKMPEMYREWADTSEAERMRDLDRASHGRMYYTESGNMGNARNYGGDADSMESSKRRMYVESKANPDKNVRLKMLDEYITAFENGSKELAKDMIPEERTMWRQKLNSIANSL